MAKRATKSYQLDTERGAENARKTTGNWSRVIKLSDMCSLRFYEVPPLKHGDDKAYAWGIGATHYYPFKTLDDAVEDAKERVPRLLRKTFDTFKESIDRVKQ